MCFPSGQSHLCDFTDSSVSVPFPWVGRESQKTWHLSLLVSTGEVSCASAQAALALWQQHGEWGHWVTAGRGRSGRSTRTGVLAGTG